MSRVWDLLNSFQSGSAGAVEFGNDAAGPAATKAAAFADGTSFVRYYRLQENPFADAIDLKYYFQTAAQQKACQQMFATAQDGISLGLLTGPSGSGKTLVTQVLLEHLDPALFKPVLVLVTPKMSKTVLLEEMVRELGVEAPPATSRELLALLHRTVVDLHRAGRKLVILIDEAHFLGADALHMLRTISNLEIPGRKLVTCLLFAEESFLRRLKHPGYASLVTRMYHRAKLGPMSPEESAQYLKYRLMAAGAPESLMDERACSAIAAAAGGIHREVNRLGYLALIEGCLRQRSLITDDLVKEA